MATRNDVLQVDKDEAQEVKDEQPPEVRPAWVSDAVSISKEDAVAHVKERMTKLKGRIKQKKWRAQFKDPDQVILYLPNVRIGR